MNPTTPYRPGQRAKALRFTQFLNRHGITAWHIHDGWLTEHNGRTADLCYDLDAATSPRLHWRNGITRYRNSGPAPEQNQKLAITTHAPGAEGIRPFAVHIFTVTGLDVPLLPTAEPDLLLQRTDTRTARWNEGKGWFEWEGKK